MRTKQNRVVALVTKRRASGESHVRVVSVHPPKFCTISVEAKWRAAENSFSARLRCGTFCAHSFAFPPTPMPLCDSLLLAIGTFHAQTLNTSLLGVKTAQKLSKGFTVKNVRFVDRSRASREASFKNVSRSPAASAYCQSTLKIGP